MKNKLIIAAFIISLAAASAVLWMPADTESVAGENRTAATMPPTDLNSIASGKFSNGFEAYIGDNLGFRSVFTGISGEIKANKGINTNLGKIVTVNKDVGTGSTQKSSLLVANNTIMEVFENKQENADWYLNVLKFYADNLDENVHLYSMLIPTQLEFQPEIYSRIQDSQKKTIDYIYQNIPDRITTVNAYDKLKDHKDEYIYYRTDHHWTALGAYYGYSSLLDALKSNDEENGDYYKPVDLDAYPKKKIDGFLGYLYKQAQSPEIKNNPDTIEWYNVNSNNKIEISDEYFENGKNIQYDSALFAEDKKDYDFFLGGDQPLIELTNTERPDGRTIIIVKDSFCNCFAPWLINNYGKVILVDPRTYEGSMQKLIDRYHPNDMLIMNYIFTTTFSDYCQMAIDVFNR